MVRAPFLLTYSCFSLGHHEREREGKREGGEEWRGREERRGGREGKAKFLFPDTGTNPIVRALLDLTTQSPPRRSIPKYHCIGD